MHLTEADMRRIGSPVTVAKAPAVADSADLRDPAVPMITLATAHPAKFPDAVEEASGLRPPLPDRMADLFERPERVTRARNDLADLKTLIQERIPS